MQCNYNSLIQIINFHGIFRNALRCRKTGACRIMVFLRYAFVFITQIHKLFYCKINNFNGRRKTRVDHYN